MWSALCYCTPYGGLKTSVKHDKMTIIWKTRKVLDKFARVTACKPRN
jgi:hypothetical protein